MHDPTLTKKVRLFIESKEIHLAFINLLHEDHGYPLYIADNLGGFIDSINDLVNERVGLRSACPNTVVPAINYLL